MERTYKVRIWYSDNSGYGFKLTMTGTENETTIEAMQVTRGTMLASNADYATCHDENGKAVIMYTK